VTGQEYRLARFLSHDAIKQASRAASRTSVQTDELFSHLLQQLDEAELPEDCASEDERREGDWLSKTRN